MPEIEVAFVKVQPRQGGSYMITIPKDAIDMIGLVDNERMKVYVDKDHKRLIYELVDLPSR